MSVWEEVDRRAGAHFHICGQPYIGTIVERRWHEAGRLVWMCCASELIGCANSSLDSTAMKLEDLVTWRTPDMGLLRLSKRLLF